MGEPMAASRLNSCSLTEGMDLDAPADMLMTPIISQPSLNNTSTDVFSLLISQVQQCHTQQVTELEQKIAHLKRKCCKLEELVKGRRELALKYRHNCLKLREENRHLKRLLEENQTRSPLRESSVSQDTNTVNKNKQGVPSQEAKESKVESIRLAPDDPKKSRLTRKKGQKKVRYAEITSPEELNHLPSARLRLKASIEEKLLVPETMDPDMYDMDQGGDDSNSDIDNDEDDQKYPLREERREQTGARIPSQNDRMVNGTDSKENQQPEPDDLLTASSPCVWKEKEGDGLPQDTSTPLYSQSRRHESRLSELSPVILEGLEDSVGDSREMSPTFAKPADVHSPLLIHSAHDASSESEASHLLLPQSLLNSGGQTHSPLANIRVSQKDYLTNRDQSHDMKRKISPLERRSKLARLSGGERSERRRSGGVWREYTSRPDRRLLEDHSRLRQSTLSQLLLPMKDNVSRATDPFKIPAVPNKINNRSRHVADENNISHSLNGSVDPLLKLDECEEHGLDSVSCQSSTKKGLHQAGGVQDASYRSEIDGSRDKSDLMFEDSVEYQQEGVHSVPVDIPDITDFDRVPKKDEGPQYKHKEVVRKHDDREKLKGFDCKQCAEFYGGMGLTDTQKEDRMKACSRHRGRFTPPSTPEHYWSIDFPDTPTCVKRGYIQEDDNNMVDPEAMPRRRNKLKQLFKN